MAVENLTVAGSNSFGKGGLVRLYDVQSSAEGAGAPTGAELIADVTAHALRQFDCATISALQERVLHDPAAFMQLLQFLTIPVSEMFRDPSHFLAIRQEVVPLLKTGVLSFTSVTVMETAWLLAFVPSDACTTMS